ncbi:MAG: TlpA family protein disulfide reductase [Anaerolineales bacterium]|nr:TlpA family protein disulfide reductase [Anaerolineales bacterium]
MTQTTLRNTSPKLDKERIPRMFWGKLLVWGLFTALMLLLGIKLYQTTLGPVSRGTAPDFTLTTFGGDSYTLSDHKGQLIVINFWASWCGPCELEADALEQAWRQYRNHGVMFLGINYVDTENEALAYLKKWGVTYPNGPDIRTSISQDYRIKGVPETYIIAQDGTIAGTVIGPIEYNNLTNALDLLLNQ